MAAVSIFPDENLGWGVYLPAPAGVPGDQLEEGSTPRLELVCCRAFEYMTRLAFRRTVADLCALLQPPHDLVMVAPHIDGHHDTCGVIRLITHSIHLSHVSRAAETSGSG